jgi:hypothetical protein
VTSANRAGRWITALVVTTLWGAAALVVGWLWYFSSLPLLFTASGLQSPSGIVGAWMGLAVVIAVVASGIAAVAALILLRLLGRAPVPSIVAASVGPVVAFLVAVVGEVYGVRSATPEAHMGYVLGMPLDVVGLAAVMLVPAAVAVVVVLVLTRHDVRN